MKKDIITDEMIRSDMKSALARNGTTPIAVVIVGTVCYALAAFWLYLGYTADPRMYLGGGIAFILSTVLTVSMICNQLPWKTEISRSNRSICSMPLYPRRMD